MTRDIDVVSEPSRLGESPVWSVAEQCLYWVDIEGRAVRRFDPATGYSRSVDVPGRPGSLALSPTDGLLLVAVEHELIWLDFAAGDTRSFVTVESDSDAPTRLNDGRADPVGRFVVGSMDEGSADGAAGKLFSIDAGGDVDVVRSNVSTANGQAFDPDAGFAYFADTPSHRIIRWRYDLGTGARTEETVFFDYRAAGVPGKPDGGCVDADGCYWSSSVYGYGIIRIDPEGRLDRRIELPVEKPTMPAFGGSDLGTMFVTTIGEREGKPSHTKDPGVPPGSLLALDVGVGGRPEPAFAGRPPAF